MANVIMAAPAEAGKGAITTTDRLTLQKGLYIIILD
ncbi:MAG: hypothetical protein HW400_225 [Candidatus Levybacteria bacterium]|nr:hypothetical protein [Candidatus Levybacteria bacterium]